MGTRDVSSLPDPEKTFAGTGVPAAGEKAPVSAGLLLQSAVKGHSPSSGQNETSLETGKMILGDKPTD